MDSCTKVSLIAILTSLIFASCLTDRQLERAYEKSPQFYGYPTQITIDGTYHLRDSSENLLWSLYDNHTFGGSGFQIIDSHRMDSSKVMLSYNGSHRLFIKTLNGDTAFHPFKLKVKNKGKYLRVRRHVLLVPIPIVATIFMQRKLLLLTDKDGRLIVIEGRKGFGQIAIIFVGITNQGSVHVFSKAE